MNSNDKKSLSRERVLGISLVDFFVQIIFLLLIILGINGSNNIHIDNIEQYEKFIAEGSDPKVYGDMFAETYVEIIQPKKYFNMEKDIQALKSQITLLQNKLNEETKKKIGFNPCLGNNESETKVSFFIERTDNFVIFKGFTNDFMEYAEAKNNIAYMNHTKNIKKDTYFDGSLNGKKKFNETFAFTRDSQCKHVFKIITNSSHMEGLTGMEVKKYNHLQELPYGAGLFEKSKLIK